MKATIISGNAKHYPVLLNEIISIITPQYGGTFIDCTFGQGGYSKKILDYPDTKVIAIDRDNESIKKAENIREKFENRFLFKNIKFSQLTNLKLKKEDIKGIIFDLGYSYTQIKDPKKGLSFDFSGELNMKLGINEFSAKEVINKLEEKELLNIFKYFGEEKESKKIARNIVEDRKSKEITTEELVRIIESTKKKKNHKTHSATKVFQALRIFVNKEISELIYGLINAAKVLKKDGIIAVVTFHSLEDKIVKYFFKSLSENKSVSRYLPKENEKINLFKLINKLEERELLNIFKYFGEEIESRKIARNIVEDRKSKEITTEELVRIIESSKKIKNYKTHSATKVFQALRIFVNKEISELIYGLINAAKVLKKDGVIAVVTFHSLEDKIVKYFFKSLSENKSVSRYLPKEDEKINLFKLVEKKPILPSKKEINENLPSRSAKLRYVIKKEDFFNFETDILEKFNYLLEIENYGKKL